MLVIGAEYYIGWNTAKALGDETAAYSYVRCEAFGKDWAVFRAKNGEPLASTFDSVANFARDIGR